MYTEIGDDKLAQERIKNAEIKITEAALALD